MTYQVRSDKDYTLQLGQSDKALSVIQNVSLILNSKCGTIPMHRDFGLPMKFADKPIDVAETIAAAEISEALERFEPRAELLDLTFEKNDKGEIVIIVEVRVVES